MKKIAILFALLLIYGLAQAAIVDTVKIYSRAMEKEIPAVVIVPDSYKTGTDAFPVLYLLHGYSGHYDNWVTLAPGVDTLADTYRMIIVCPEGNYSSWYVDSPIDKQWQYGTHVAQEVPKYIDSHYRTIANKAGRAITGLSMGGHGALYLAFRNPEIFGACGSMSGALDLTAAKSGYALVERLGSDDSDLLKQYSVVHTAAIILQYPMPLIIDCGTEDYLQDATKQLHNFLLEHKYPHTFIQRPGSHNWDYWRESVVYQSMFFYRFFYGNGL